MPLKPIEDAIYETVHRGAKPPKQVADETGISYNYLMRMSMPGDSGCNFNLKFLVPIMKAQDCYAVLSTLNQLCGFMPPVKAPRGTKQGSRKDLLQYQKDANHMITRVIAFLQEPSEARWKEIDALMRQHMSDTECMRRRCKKNLMDQMEMF